jgi:dATP pyrophosphohydrolase
MAPPPGCKVIVDYHLLIVLLEHNIINFWPPQGRKPLQAAASDQLTFRRAEAGKTSARRQHDSTTARQHDSTSRRQHLNRRETNVRQPLQVIVFPFRVTAGGPEYAIFRRADDGCWQGVAGGVEEGEDLVTAARRETAEEAGLTGGNPVYKLDMVSGVARTCFGASRHWPSDLYIVAKHHFAMDVTRDPAPVALPDEHSEHSEFRWVPYGEASATLRYDDDKTALWELDARLRTSDLPAAAPDGVRQRGVPQRGGTSAETPPAGG